MIDDNVAFKEQNSGKIEYLPAVCLAYKTLTKTAEDGCGRIAAVEFGKMSDQGEGKDELIEATQNKYYYKEFVVSTKETCDCEWVAGMRTAEDISWLHHLRYIKNRACFKLCSYKIQAPVLPQPKDVEIQW
jgi:hypothetical protein